MKKNKLVILFEQNIFPILLVIVTTFICLLNFKPGTWLSGWDTLHPEFNFPLNFKRLFFGVWREEQGLGAVAGHSHMADLPRVAVLWLLSLVFPTNILRYLYIFLCLILGPLGIFYFITQFFSKNKNVAFLGALFYFFNLGTLQHFYVPFEMFCVQYAALGWLFLFATKFWKEGKKKDLFIFFLLNFLAAPQAYAATLFYVYFASILIFFLTISFLFKNYSNNFKKTLLLIIVTIFANSFWLLPNLYFLKTNAKNVPDAQINLLFSEEAFLKNKKFGTIQDTAILKNFLFDWKKVEGGNFVPLLKTWINYLTKPIILGIGYLAFFCIVLGIFTSLKERNKFIKPPLFLFLICLFFIVGMNFPFTSIYSFFQNSFSFLKEALRMPFTKFSLVLMLTYAVFFALGNNILLEKIIKIVPKIRFFYVMFWMFLLVAFCWPFFRGELISSAMKVKIPEEYFQAFEFFNKQNNLRRIANFPSPVYSGWEYYDWGFQGAGFFWFGQKMALLNRDFDRWNPVNENYYHEISYAVYSQNLSLLENILEKYQISWLLLDGNIVSFTSPKSLYFDQLEKLISYSSKIKFNASFGKIKIYQVVLETKPNDFVFLAENLPQVGPIYQWNNFDQVFNDFGNYLSQLDAKRYQLDADVYYPFRSLFTGRKQEELEFKVEDRGDSFIFKAKIPDKLKDGKLILPEISEPEILEIAENDLTKIKSLNPEVNLDKEGNLEVKVVKAQCIFSYDSDRDKAFFNKESQTCDAINQGKYSLEKINENGKDFLRFSALNSSSCLDINLPNLGNRYSYLVTVESRNLKGKSMLFWVENIQSRKADMETYLPKTQNLKLKTQNFEKYYFVQPPMERYGLGYSLHFNNISIGREGTINDLAKVSVHPIPYKFLTSLKIVKNPPEILNSNFLILNSVSHPNESFYKVEIFANTQPPTPNTYLVLSQSFNKDWIALEKTGPFSFKKLKDHVLVNNWENGWQLPVTSHQSPATIYIFFWPQVLEYLGFLLLLATPLVIWKLDFKEEMLDN